MNIKEATDFGISSISTIFNQEDSREALINTEILLAQAINKNSLFLKTNKDYILTEEQKKTFYSYIERRLKLEPVQYITGNTFFWDLEFKVGEGVLIPRQDTETLIETVLNTYKNKDEELLFLDLCCGSGCIGITLLKEYKNSKCIFTDLSNKALEYTKINAELNNVINRASIIQSDLFEKIYNYKFDFIVSNPPYIEKQTIQSLTIDITNYEPKMALDGGIDGLDFYKKIAKESKKIIKNNGSVFVEIGYNQGLTVSNLFAEHYTKTKIIKDLCKQDRVILSLDQ